MEDLEPEDLPSISEFDGAIAITEDDESSPEDDVEQAKLEISSKSALLQDHSRKLALIDELQSKNDALAQRNRLLELKLTRERKAYEQKYQAFQQQTKAEIERLRAKQAELEAMCPLSSNLLKAVQEALAETTTISEARYLELKSMPMQQLGLVEYISMCWYEQRSRYHKELESCRIEMDSLRQRLSEVSMEHQSLKREHSKLATAYREQVDLLEQNIHALRTKLSSLQGEYARAVDEAEQLRAKGTAYDQLRQRADELEQQLQAAIEERDRQQRRADDAEWRAKQADERATEAEHRAELLRMDKDYLAKEAELHQLQATRLEGALQASSEKLRRAKRARDELVDQLARIRAEQQALYDDKLAVELAKLRTQADAAKEEARMQLQLQERELAAWRDARDRALADAEKAQAKLEETRTLYTSLQDELRNVQARLEAQLAEANGQLKLRAFELERALLAHEDTKQALTQSTLDLKKAERKLELVKEEYHTLQATSARRVAELETLLAEKAEKLAHYEGELTPPLSTTTEQPETVRMSQAKLGTSHMADLARRLAQEQTARQTLAKQLEAEREEKQALAAKLAESTEQLQKTQQPYHFLIDTIKNRDIALEKQSRLVAELEKEVAKLKQELDKSRAKCAKLSQVLERVLANQSAASSLRKLMEQTLSHSGLHTTALEQSATKPNNPTIISLATPSWSHG